MLSQYPFDEGIGLNMVTIKQIIERLDEMAGEIKNLTEGQGDFHPWGDIRVRTIHMETLLKELKAEEGFIEKEIGRDRKNMLRIERLLGY